MKKLFTFIFAILFISCSAIFVSGTVANEAKKPENVAQAATMTEKVFFDADNATKLSGGRDTGNTATIGLATDETYGQVWTLQSANAATTDFHAVGLDASAYNEIKFRIYNPISEDVGLVLYTRSWGSRSAVSMKAGEWTEITVDVTTYGSTFFCVIDTPKSNEGIWKITGFFAMEETVETGNIRLVFDADDASKLSGGRDTGNAATIGLATDETYGQVWTLQSAKAATTDFHPVGLDASAYNKIKFRIYNPLNEDVKLVLYTSKWGSQSAVLMKAGEWTEITVDVTTYGSTFFCVIDTPRSNEGVWRISGFYVDETDKTVTVTDEDGNVLSSGADAENYDGSVLNTSDIKFVGFEYGGKLYKTVKDAKNVATTDVNLVAKTYTVKVAAGAAVRLVGESGLRFTANVDLKAAEFGVILSAPELFGNSDFTKEALMEANINFKEAGTCKESFNYAERGEYKEFNIVLKNIKEENYKKYFAARAYVTVTYADGTKANVYSTYNADDHSRSVYHVAKAAYAKKEYVVNGAEVEEYKQKLENYIADELIAANDAAKLASGRDNGIKDKVKVELVNDSVYGSVWAISATDPDGITGNGDFHAVYPPDVTGYKQVVFNIYNPTDVDISLVCYTVSWGNGKTIATAKGKEWTKVYVDTAIYGNDFFIILNNGQWKNGTWLITGYKGIPEDQTAAETYNEFTVNALQGAFTIDSNGTFDILAYHGPSAGIVHDNRTNKEIENRWVLYRTSSTLYNIKKYFDAGFKYWCADDCWYGRAYLKELADMDYEYDAFWALDMAAEFYRMYDVECPVIITFDGLANAMEGSFKLNNTEVGEEYYKEWLKNAVQTVKNYRPRNGGKNFFKGIQLADEPSVSETESYAKMYNYLTEELNLTADGYILNSSFFGTIGNETQVGSDYNAYIENYLAAMNGEKVILYDNYPFKLKETSFIITKHTPILVESYFSNMQTISKIATKKGLKAGICIQSMAFDNNGGSKWSNTNYYINDQKNISMQLYSALAFGYSYFNYFVYTTPMDLNDSETYTDSPVGWGDDKKSIVYNLMYDWVKNVNNEVKNFENVLSEFTYRGTQVVGSLSGVTSDLTIGATATYSALIGHYEKNGLKSYVVANAYDPTANSESNTITLTIGTPAAVVYINGIPSIMTADGGELTLNLGAGAGAFVIPIAD